MEEVTSPGLEHRRIDHYLLESLIATTTTASIYKGTDTRDGRRVAVKIPHIEVEGDPLFYQRFLREQTIGQKLDHPLVVRFISDENRTGVYLVTEWVEGRLLRDFLRESDRLPIERAIRIMTGICEALEYIHGRGVIHRDLKPENIMVNAEDRVTLIDFGIASLVGARRLTFGKLSHVMGTPDYISPEQVQGRRGDARSDLYAAGVMLYEMLTGSTPFPGDGPLMIMNSRLINPPVPPREVDASISIELQEVILRALEREPDCRYSSAGEFLRDLRHPEQVIVRIREEAAIEERHPSQWTRTALRYAGLALIPFFIFALLLLAARQQR